MGSVSCDQVSLTRHDDIREAQFAADGHAPAEKERVLSADLFQVATQQLQRDDETCRRRLGQSAQENLQELLEGWGRGWAEPPTVAAGGRVFGAGLADDVLMDLVPLVLIVTPAEQASDL